MVQRIFIEVIFVFFYLGWLWLLDWQNQDCRELVVVVGGYVIFFAGFVQLGCWKCLFFFLGVLFQWKRCWILDIEGKRFFFLWSVQFLQCCFFAFSYCFVGLVGGILIQEVGLRVVQRGLELLSEGGVSRKLEFMCGFRKDSDFFIFCLL